ncbi:hypothetical protein BC828DRAFT_402977 [Blastocladiella britannica]|nr:hypothetical protein BC828DRAFT_402977 [Blastocladiella britannica]
MKITKTPSRRPADPPEPLLQLLRSLEAATDDASLLAALQNAPSDWPYPRGDLYSWLPVLNKFDDVLMRACIEGDFANMQPQPLSAPMRTLVLEVLRWSRVLMETCANRALYASFEHLNDMLCTHDTELLVAVLHLLLRPAQRAAMQRSLKQSFAVSHERLAAIAAPLTSRDDKLGDLLDPEYLIADQFTRVEFSFYRPAATVSAAEEARQEHDAKNGEDTVMKDVPPPALPEGTAHISVPTETLLTAGPTLTRDLVRLHQVPSSRTAGGDSAVRAAVALQSALTGGPASIPFRQETQHPAFHLHRRVMVASVMARGAEGMADRARLATARALAVAVLAYVAPEDAAAPPSISTGAAASVAAAVSKDVVFELVDLGRSDNTVAPPECRAAAVTAIMAIARWRTRLGDVLVGLGAAASHGVVMTMVRRVLAWLQTDPATATASSPLTGAAEATITTEYADAVQALVAYLVTLQAPGTSLINAGLMPALTAVFTSHPAHARGAAKWVSLMDSLVYGFPTAYPSFSGAHGLTHLVARLATDTTADKIAPLDAERDFETVAWLKSMLKFVYHMLQTVQGPELRNLVESTLPASLAELISKLSLGSVSATALNTLATMVHNEPTCLAILQESRIAHRVLDSIAQSIPPSSDVIMALPNVFGAFSLNTPGLDYVIESGAVLALVDLLKSPSHMKILAETESAQTVGGGVDELLRHQPDLKPRVLDRIVAVLDSFPEVAAAAIAARPPPPLLLLEDDPTPDPNAPELVADIVHVVDGATRFVEGLLQSGTHAVALIERGAVPKLLSIFALPGLPPGFPSSPASYSLSHLFRSLADVDARLTCKAVVGAVYIAVGKWAADIEANPMATIRWDTLTRVAVLPDHRQRALEIEAMLSQLVGLLGVVGLMSDVYSPTSWPSKNAPAYVSMLIEMLHLGTDAEGLSALLRLHAYVMRQMLVMRAHVPPKYYNDAKRTRTPGTLLESWGIPGLDEPLPLPEGEEVDTRNPTHVNTRVLRGLLYDLHGCLTPMVQSVAKMALAKRNADAAHKQGCRTLAKALVKSMKQEYFADQMTEGMPAATLYVYMQLTHGLVTLALLDERQSSTMHVVMLYYALQEGLINKVSPPVEPFVGDNNDNKLVDKWGRSLAWPDPTRWDMFATLLQYMSAARAITESPFVVPMTGVNNFDMSHLVLASRHFVFGVFNAMLESPASVTRIPDVAIRPLSRALMHLLKGDGESPSTSRRGPFGARTGAGGIPFNMLVGGQGGPGGPLGDGVGGGVHDPEQFLQLLEEMNAQRELGGAGDAGGAGGIQALFGNLFGGGGPMGGAFPPPGVGGGGAHRTPVARPRPPRPTADPAALAMLTDMGFAEAVAREALVRCGNNVERATEYILTHPGLEFEVQQQEQQATAAGAAASAAATPAPEGAAAAAPADSSAAADSEQPAAPAAADTPMEMVPSSQVAEAVMQDAPAAGEAAPASGNTQEAEDDNADEVEEDDDDENYEDVSDDDDADAMSVTEPTDATATGSSRSAQPAAAPASPNTEPSWIPNADLATSVPAQRTALLPRVIDLLLAILTTHPDTLADLREVLMQLPDEHGVQSLLSRLDTAEPDRLPPLLAQIAILFADNAKQKAILSHVLDKLPQLLVHFFQFADMANALDASLAARRDRQWVPLLCLFEMVLNYAQEPVFMEMPKIDGDKIKSTPPTNMENRNKVAETFSPEIVARMVTELTKWLKNMPDLSSTSAAVAAATPADTAAAPVVLSESAMDVTQGSSADLATSAAPAVVAPRDNETVVLELRQKATAEAVLRMLARLTRDKDACHCFVNEAGNVVDLLARFSPIHLSVIILRHIVEFAHSLMLPMVVRSEIKNSALLLHPRGSVVPVGPVHVDVNSLVKACAHVALRHPEAFETAVKELYTVAQYDPTHRYLQLKPRDAPAPSVSAVSMTVVMDSLASQLLALKDSQDTEGSNMIHAKRIFLMKMTSELVFSYVPCKVALMDTPRRRAPSTPAKQLQPGQAAKDTPAPKSAFVSYLVERILPWTGVYSSNDIPSSVRKQLFESQWASTVLSCLCANPDGDETELDTAHPIHSVRRAVVDALHRALVHNDMAERPDVRYGKYLALSDAVYRILSWPSKHSGRAPHPPAIPGRPAAAQDTAPVPLVRSLVDRQFVMQLTNLLAKVDTHHPEAKLIVTSILKPIELLTKLAVNLSQLAKTPSVGAPASSAGASSSTVAAAAASSSAGPATPGSALAGGVAGSSTHAPVTPAPVRVPVETPGHEMHEHAVPILDTPTMDALAHADEALRNSSLGILDGAADVTMHDRSDDDHGHDHDMDDDSDDMDGDEEGGAYDEMSGSESGAVSDMSDDDLEGDDMEIVVRPNHPHSLIAEHAASQQAHLHHHHHHHHHDSDSDSVIDEMDVDTGSSGDDDIDDDDSMDDDDHDHGSDLDEPAAQLYGDAGGNTSGYEDVDSDEDVDDDDEQGQDVDLAAAAAAAVGGGAGYPEFGGMDGAFLQYPAPGQVDPMALFEEFGAQAGHLNQFQFDVDMDEEDDGQDDDDMDDGDEDDGDEDEDEDVLPGRHGGMAGRGLDALLNMAINNGGVINMEDAMMAPHMLHRGGGLLRGGAQTLHQFLHGPARGIVPGANAGGGGGAPGMAYVPDLAHPLFTQQQQRNNATSGSAAHARTHAGGPMDMGARRNQLGNMTEAMAGIMDQFGQQPGGVPVDIRVNRAHGGAGGSSRIEVLSPNDPIVNDFEPLSTTDRWMTEARLLYGTNVQERATRLVAILTLAFLPEALALKRAKDLEDKKRAEDQKLAAEQAAKAHAAQEEALRKLEAEVREKQEAERQLQLQQQQASSSAVSEAPDAEAAAPATSPAAPVEEAAAAQPEVEPLYFEVDGEMVDLAGSGIDPTFLMALPDELRGEVIRQHLAELEASRPRPAAPASAAAAGVAGAAGAAQPGADLLASLPSDFLNVLQPDIRQGLFAELNAAAAPGDTHAAATAATAAVAGPAYGTMAPGGIAAAMFGGRDFPLGGAAEQAQLQQQQLQAKTPGKRRDAVHLLDRAHVSTLLRLLFAETPIAKPNLIKLLGTLCENNKSRNDILTLLMDLLAHGPSMAMLHSDMDGALPYVTIEERSLETLLALIKQAPHIAQFFVAAPAATAAAATGATSEAALPPLLSLIRLLQCTHFVEMAMELLATVSPIAATRAPAATPTPVTASAAVPAAEAAASSASADAGTEAAPAPPATKESESVPQTKFVVPPLYVRLILNVLAGECPIRTFQFVLVVIQHLATGANFATFVKELESLAQSTSGQLSIELAELAFTLTAVEKEEAAPSAASSGVLMSPTSPSAAAAATIKRSSKAEAALQKFSHPASRQALLLRLLKTVDFLSTKQKRPIPITLAMNSLWSSLSRCLSATKGREDLISVLLPAIESLLVVEAKAPDAQFADFTTKHRKELNVLVRNNPTLMSGSFAILVQSPKVLEFDNKRAYFYQKLLAQRPRRTFSQIINLNLRRQFVFEDSYHQLQHRTGDEIKYGRLNVKFNDEEGVDAGGLTREWYSVLARSIFNPNYALFLTSAADKITYQPNRASHINPDHLHFFRFVGRFIGKAIYDQKLLDCYFTRSFYKHMLGKAVDIKDMETVDPSYTKSLEWILDNSIDDVMDLTFSVEDDYFGTTRIVDLVPDGRNVAVTDDNKAEYVRLIVEQRLSVAIREQIDAFMSGFLDVMPKELVAIFDEQELELLISGMPEIDIDDWRNNTQYHHYTASSPVIAWFWRAVRSFDQEQRAKLVQFTTGTSKVPLEGFKALQGSSGVAKFTIVRDPGGAHRLPSAHTCFNQLDLPEYASYDDLRRAVLKVIDVGSEGFGFA